MQKQSGNELNPNLKLSSLDNIISGKGTNIREVKEDININGIK